MCFFRKKSQYKAVRNCVNIKQWSVSLMLTNYHFLLTERPQSISHSRRADESRAEAGRSKSVSWTFEAASALLFADSLSDAWWRRAHVSIFSCFDYFLNIQRPNGRNWSCESPHFNHPAPLFTYKGSDRKLVTDTSSRKLVTEACHRQHIEVPSLRRVENP